MNSLFQNAFRAGVDRVSAWADLLDRINVFPVADGDTGRNLMISLSPLRQLNDHRQQTIRNLLMSARGNSGNIAAQFFSGFLQADSWEKLPNAAETGRDKAWQAIGNPQPGTMLTVLDALTESLKKYPNRDWESIESIRAHLEQAVRSTPNLLPQLKEADVVDAGALGMFIYLESFFFTIIGKTDGFYPLVSGFGKLLCVDTQFQAEDHNGYCVDMVIRASDDMISEIRKFGDDVVWIPDHDRVKVHLHTERRIELKQRIESAGQIVRWQEDHLKDQIRNFRLPHASQAIHIMTDAAGSMTRDDAKRWDVTLLHSYIQIGDSSLPETCTLPDDLYAAMRNGVRVSTSQASAFERHELYQRVLDQYPKVLYVCVGSVFTGNYEVAMAWKKANDPENRFVVLDTAAASGKLGMIALAAADYSTKTDDAEAVIRFTQDAINQCREFVFLERLQYLAAGGRLSKTSAFFGDMLRMKPVISPTAEGAKKVAVVRNSADQIRYAVRQLETSIDNEKNPFIMLEYSDNRDFVNNTVQPEIKRCCPDAQIIVQPLSLTSGAHMGPGTWGIAILNYEEISHV